MDKYLTLKELYETKSFDESFLRTFDKLYDKAKDRVLEKNKYLKSYLSRPKESVYDSLDFSQERINVDSIILRPLSNDMKCYNGHELKKVSVRTIVNESQKGIYLMACPICKRFYSEMKEDIEKLERMNIHYYIFEPEMDIR